jgi:hypothetical protein
VLFAEEVGDEPMELGVLLKEPPPPLSPTLAGDGVLAFFPILTI